MHMTANYSHKKCWLLSRAQPPRKEPLGNFSCFLKAVNSVIDRSQKSKESERKYQVNNGFKGKMGDSIKERSLEDY